MRASTSGCCEIRYLQWRRKLTNGGQLCQFWTEPCEDCADGDDEKSCNKQTRLEHAVHGDWVSEHSQRPGHGVAGGVEACANHR